MSLPMTLASMGFDVIYKNGIYKEHFVPFFNEVAPSSRTRA